MVDDNELESVEALGASLLDVVNFENDPHFDFPLSGDETRGTVLLLLKSVSKVVVGTEGIRG